MKTFGELTKVVSVNKKRKRKFFLVITDPNWKKKFSKWVNFPWSIRESKRRHEPETEEIKFHLQLIHPFNRALIICSKFFFTLWKIVNSFFLPFCFNIIILLKKNLFFFYLFMVSIFCSNCFFLFINTFFYIITFVMSEVVKVLHFYSLKLSKLILLN